jgi:hypothetical protein
LQIINTVERGRSFSISASGLPNVEVALDEAQPVEVAAASSRIVPVRLQVKPEGLQPGTHRMEFHVQAFDDPRVATDEKSVFFSR